MANINGLFSDFLSDIRLTPNQKSDLKTGHTTLRNRLNADADLSSVVVSTFLQGSYKRSTAVRPSSGKRADVDIIIVTNLDRFNVTPHQALEKFEPFVKKHYDGKYRIQGRSIGIELSYVDLDIVITSAPSEIEQTNLRSKSVTSDLMLEDLQVGSYDLRFNKAWTEPDIMKGGYISLSEAVRAQAEWKSEALWIPDRDADKWEQTDPLEQIKWTRDKNKNTNKHYINVVKALKWWKLVRLVDLKHPKGYPIEHMVGDNCPDDITSVGEGVCLTLEAIVSNYANDYYWSRVPVLADRGVPTHNVWKRITWEDFKAFYESVKTYAVIAREALYATSLKVQTDKWREVFGSKFPEGPDDDGGTGNKSGGSGPTGFSDRTAPTNPGRQTFA